MSPNAEQLFTVLLEKSHVAVGAVWRSEVEQAAHLYPDHPGIQSLLAELLISRGKLEVAEELIELARKSAPFDPFCQSALGELKVRQQKYSEARETLLAVLSQDPANFSALAHLIPLLSHLGFRDEADSYRYLAEKTFPDSPYVMRAVCQSYFLENDIEKVTEIADRFIDAESGSFLAIKGIVALSRKDIKQAEVWARQAIAVNQESKLAWDLLRKVLTFTGDHPGAKQAAQEVLKLDPLSDGALRNLAKIAKIEGDEQASIEFLKKANELSPPTDEIEVIKATSDLIATRQPDRALDELEKHLTSKSLEARKLASSRILSVLRIHPKRNNADYLLGEVIKVTGESVDYFTGKVKVLLERKEFDEALHLIELGLQKFPGNLELQTAKLGYFKATNKTEKLRVLATEMLTKGFGSPHHYLFVVATLSGTDLSDLGTKYLDDLRIRFPNFRSTGVVEAMVEINKGNHNVGIEKFHELARSGVIKQDPFRPKVMARIWFLRFLDLFVVPYRRFVRRRKSG